VVAVNATAMQVPLAPEDRQPEYGAIEEWTIALNKDIEQGGEIMPTFEDLGRMMLLQKQLRDEADYSRDREEDVGKLTAHVVWELEERSARGAS
jgi:hypothetical protein